MNPRGGTLLTGMFIAAALSPLGSTMIAVALPSISSELGVSGGALTQWLVASYLIAGIAAMSPCGKLGDIIGHRRGLLIGMSIYAAAALDTQPTHVRLATDFEVRPMAYWFEIDDQVHVVGRPLPGRFDDPAVQFEGLLGSILPIQHQR